MVALYVRKPLSVPVRFICCRSNASIFAIMHVKEATVYIYDFMMSRKDHIGLSWEVLFMKAISKPHSMNNRTNYHFRLRIPVVDTRHIEAPLAGRKVIGHQTYACGSALLCDTLQRLVSALSRRRIATSSSTLDWRAWTTRTTSPT